MVPVELVLVLSLLAVGLLGVLGLLVVYVARGARYLGESAELLKALEGGKKPSAPV